MTTKSIDRFDSREEVEWNRGAYDDGFRARTDGHGLDTCPTTGGKWFQDSWRAGWADADQDINSEKYAEA